MTRNGPRGLRRPCGSGPDLVALTADLLRIDSANSPSDTVAIADYVPARLTRLDGIRLIAHEPATAL